MVHSRSGPVEERLRVMGEARALLVFVAVS